MQDVSYIKVTVIQFKWEGYGKGKIGGFREEMEELLAEII